MATTAPNKKRLTKAEQIKAKKKRDKEVMFWGIAGCVILIGFAFGWGKLAPTAGQEDHSTEEVSQMGSMTDFQIDDILDAVDDQCEKVDEEKYVVTLEQLRDILEMVLKEGE